VLVPGIGFTQMRMSLLTGVNGDAGSAPVTSMVYAPGASPSMVIALRLAGGRVLR
jgi:hypothetical protein